MKEIIIIGSKLHFADINVKITDICLKGADISRKRTDISMKLTDILQITADKVANLTTHEVHLLYMIKILELVM